MREDEQLCEVLTVHVPLQPLLVSLLQPSKEGNLKLHCMPLLWTLCVALLFLTATRHSFAAAALSVEVLMRPAAIMGIWLDRWVVVTNKQLILYKDKQVPPSVAHYSTVALSLQAQ